MDIELQTDKQAITPPERQNLNVPEAEISSMLPKTAKLGYLTVQKNRIANALETLREKAVSEFVQLSGFKGTLSTTLNGLKLTVTAGVSEYPTALPKFQEEVDKAYNEPTQILKEALAAGAAEMREAKDFNIVLVRPEKEDKPKSPSQISTLISSCLNQDIEISSEALKDSHPTLRTALFCQIQNRRLEAGVKRLRPHAQAELEAYPNTNINTALNGQDIRISTFSKSNIRLLADQPEWAAKLKAAQKSAAVKLAALEKAGKAQINKTFYLTVKMQAVKAPSQTEATTSTSV